MKNNISLDIEDKLQSISDLLIAMLCSARNSKRFRSLIREREFKRYNKESVRVSLTRLNKKGYVRNLNGEWKITDKGKKYLQLNSKNEYIPSPFKKESECNTILSFDISENSRRMRNWLRNQLKIFGYKMLQQSLWIGPGPLPQEFLKKLKELKIRENIKIFTISK